MRTSWTIGDHWLGVWKSYWNQGHCGGSLGKLRKLKEKSLKILGCMASLVNFLWKSFQSREINRNIIKILCRLGGFFGKMWYWGSDFRIIGPHYANPGQNNQKYMRFRAQPGGKHPNIIDFKGQWHQNPTKSMEFWCQINKILGNTGCGTVGDH